MAQEQLRDIRAGALSGTALLEGLSQLLKSAETDDVDAAEEEDPVTTWLIHKLKEVIHGKPSKNKILTGLRKLLQEAGEWEQEEGQPMVETNTSSRGSS